MKAASAVASWYLLEARRILEAIKAPEATSDAQLLIEWLQRLDVSDISPRAILRYGPSKLRDKRRRDAALRELLETNYLAELKLNKETTLIINPALRNGQ